MTDANNRFAKWRPTTRLTCEVVFLSAAEGGRSQPIRELSSRNYRPHFLVESRQNRPRSRSSLRPEEILYGVIFAEGPELVEPGTSYEVVVLLPFFPEEKYEKLVPGATFTIREGVINVVGHGTVQTREDPPAA